MKISGKTKEQVESEKLKQKNEQRITELKKLLADTDYVALADYDKEKPDVLEMRKAWRLEIRQLEIE
jgi:hypothetical protein